MSDYIKINQEEIEMDGPRWEQIKSALTKETVNEWIDCPECNGRGEYICKLVKGEICWHDKPTICETCNGDGEILFSKTDKVNIKYTTTGLPYMHVPSEIMKPDADVDDKATFERCKEIMKSIRRSDHDNALNPMVDFDLDEF